MHQGWTLPRTIMTLPVAAIDVDPVHGGSQRGLSSIMIPISPGPGV